MEYLLHIAVLLAIYSILAFSLDLLLGHTGILSVAHGAFFGIGAYSAALLSTRANVSFPVGVIGAIGISAVMSVFISAGAARLRGERLVLLTFAFQVLMVNVAMNWTQLTGGTVGISRIPPPSFMGWSIASQSRVTALAIAFALVAYVVTRRVINSPYGRVLRAIREDEQYASAVGKDPRSYKVGIIMLSASVAASAGALYAHYMTYIAPADFDIGVSLLLISMVVLGGAGSSWGPLIGVATLVLLPEGLRFLGVPGPLAANIRQIVYGSLLLVMMLVRPEGLLGKYAFGR